MSALPLPAPADNHDTRALAPRQTMPQRSARQRAADRWTIEPNLDFAVLDDPALEGAPAQRASRVAFVTGDRVAAPASGGARRAVLRLLVTAVAIATALFLFFPAGVEADSAPHATTTYVVQPGDTLWSLAAARTPAGSDVRATIAEIKDLNDLAGSMLLVGDQMLLPVTGP